MYFLLLSLEGVIEFIFLGKINSIDYTIRIKGDGGL